MQFYFKKNPELKVGTYNHTCEIPIMNLALDETYQKIGDKYIIEHLVSDIPDIVRKITCSHAFKVFLDGEELSSDENSDIQLYNYTILIRTY